MRVLILGAAGRAGRAVLTSLFTLPEIIEAVFLGDGDAESLTRMASHPAPFPLYLRYLDAGDRRSLRERLSEVELVLGCLGPFHLHEERIVRAVLESGCDYLSLCDDARITREILSRKDEAASTGSRILLGCGMAPGLSNLLAMRAASRLEKVERLAFFWRLEGVLSLGEASVRQLAHSLTGKAFILRNGREDRVRAGSWLEVVDFPPPAGSSLLYFLDRPEPLTVSRRLGEVKEAWFKAGIGQRSEDFLLQILARLGEEGYAELLMGLLRLAGGKGRLCREGPCSSFLRVTAEGRRGGESRRVHLACGGDYYRVTGCLAAAAVEWILDSDPPPGIYTPEEVLDHPRVFRLLGRSGLRFFLAEEAADGDEERRAVIF